MEVSIRSERWHPSSGAPIQSQDLYVYDHAGRLNKEYADDHVLTCMYDARGNMQSARRVGSTGQFNQTYVYDGDRLKSMTLSSTNTQDIVSFAHDALGRMTFDGTTGQSMAYNSLDLVGNITGNGTTLVNYSYLSDGTKLSALDGSGEGLVYRGPFVYRKSSGSSSLTLESAAFGGGRLTPAGAMLYVRDYLGSVRAVVDGKTGQLYKAADYSAFGEESAVMVPAQGSAPAHPLATAAMPSGLTLRDGYTGKEAQDPDFSTGYTDFGARQYNPALRRWMTPDPLSEKYYGISPYAFCNNNPVNLVDPDGKRILGASKHDAEKVVSDFHNIFSDDIFDSFRQLIKLDHRRKRQVAKISEEDINHVLSNPNLNDDQRALIQVAYNTINSSDNHIVEYAGQGNISSLAQNVFEPTMREDSNWTMVINSVIEKNGGIPASILSAYGGVQGVTTAMYKGSYSVIFDGTHDNGRCVTTGHEVFGHGRSLALGRGDESQHVDAIQMENLILRVMRINYINNGLNHGPGTIIANPSDIPSYR